MQYVKEYSNDYVAAQIFDSQRELDNHEERIKTYREEWVLMRDALGKVGLITGGRFSSFGESHQFVSLWLTKPEDIPAIPQNGMYVSVKIDLERHIIEPSGEYGHIWLTDADQKKSYLCMCGLKEVVKKTGHKWLRKTHYTNYEDLATRLSRFVAECKQALDEATEGYPYKRMKLNIK